MRKLIPQDPTHIGPYRLTHRLGTGGMGRVYLARTPSGIQVVVKVVLPSLLEESRLAEGGTDYRRRFAREAELASRVGGFYTAEVVDSDPHAESPWIAYAYIRGRSLREALQEGPLDPPSLRALAAGLAEGLQAIHGSGLIHRDLKPGNVILAEDGPRIIDFGVARPTQGSSLTATGHLFGTLPYMSPEQAEGTRLSPASDVFALGTLLAHAATGVNPFDTTSGPRVLLRLVSPPPVEILTSLPPDLRSLIADCWNHDPELRPSPRRIIERCVREDLPRTWPPRLLPPGASASPDPLRSARSPGSPESPGPPGPPQDDRNPRELPAPRSGAQGEPEGQRAVRPDAPEGLRDTPSPEQTSSSTPPGVLPGDQGFAEKDRRPPGGRPDAPDGRHHAPDSRTPGSSQYGPLPERLPFERTPESAARGPRRSALLALAGAVLALVVGVAVWQGPWFRSAGEGSNGRAGAGPSALPPSASPTPSPAPSPDAAANTLWADSPSGDTSSEVLGSTDGADLWPLAVSPDGSLLATGIGRDQNVRVHLWETGDGTQRAVFDGFDRRVRDLAFNHDGSLLAAASWDGTVRVWDVTAEEEVTEPLTAHGDQVRAVGFAPDGGLLTTGGADGNVYLWDTGDFEPVRVIEHADGVLTVVFSPDGASVATSSSAGTDTPGVVGEVRLWDVETGEEVRDYPLTLPEGAENESARALAFDADGAVLAAAGTGGVIHLWAVDDPGDHEVIDVLDERSADPVRNIIHELAFSPDGTAMATVGGDRLVRVWDVAAREELRRLTDHSAFTRGVGFSPDGATLYTCSDDGTVRAWPASA